MEALSCKTVVDDKGREIKEHGTALFPVAAYHDDLLLDDVPWHWHEELEALIVTEGTAVVAVEQERFTLSRGEGCFINSNVLHGAWNRESGKPCRLHSLVFHPRLIGGSAESIFWQKYLHPVLENQAFSALVFRGEKDAAALNWIEEAWRACVEEPAGYEFLTRHALSQLLLSVCEHLPPDLDRRSAKELRDEQRMKTMLRYIRRNLAETLTIEGIAASASVSESECIRCFRNMIGTTPIRYVIQLRLQRAAELLMQTDDKITEIGAACGFQEMSYFARAFRQQYGATPSAYREAKGQ